MSFHKWPDQKIWAFLTIAACQHLCWERDRRGAPKGASQVPLPGQHAVQSLETDTCLGRGRTEGRLLFFQLSGSIASKFGPNTGITYDSEINYTSVVLDACWTSSGRIWMFSTWSWLHWYIIARLVYADGPLKLFESQEGLCFEPTDVEEFPIGIGCRLFSERHPYRSLRKLGIYHGWMSVE